LQVYPRFIPAGAGNTYGLTENVDKDAVYPRWRGEHSFNDNVKQHATGLSPLARGTQ